MSVVVVIVLVVGRVVVMVMTEVVVRTAVLVVMEGMMGMCPCRTVVTSIIVLDVVNIIALHVGVSVGVSLAVRDVVKLPVAIFEPCTITTAWQPQQQT